MENIPIYVSATFIAIVIATLGFLFYAFNAAASRRKTLIVTMVAMMVWILFVSFLTYRGFFTDFSMPPRLILFVGVVLVVIIGLFLMRKTRAFLNQVPITTLTYIHIIRVPVEMVLL